MPLPPALANRLAKRGLITGQTENSSPMTVVPPDVEEVIAEDYDSQRQEPMDEEITQSSLELKFIGHRGCPNKSSIFHECSPWCVAAWGAGIVNPDAGYLAKQRRALAKYPLPPRWKDVYDPGSGRHYYWDTVSDTVSWLPPRHPRAVVSEPASRLREERLMVEEEEEDEEEEDEEDDDDDGEDEGAAVSDEEAAIQRTRDEQARRNEQRQRQRARGRSKVKDNDIDPMDPAAYSDIPRGTWSTGLMKGDEAKTGVDTTASGPLFQMRPYPNPGAILRASGKPKPKPTVSFPEQPAPSRPK